MMFFLGLITRCKDEFFIKRTNKFLKSINPNFSDQKILGVKLIDTNMHSLCVKRILKICYPVSRSIILIIFLLVTPLFTTLKIGEFLKALSLQKKW